MRLTQVRNFIYCVGFQPLFSNVKKKKMNSALHQNLVPGRSDQDESSFDLWTDEARTRW